MTIPRHRTLDPFVLALESARSELTQSEIQKEAILKQQIEVEQKIRHLQILIESLEHLIRYSEARVTPPRSTHADNKISEKLSNQTENRRQSKIIELFQKQAPGVDLAAHEIQENLQSRGINQDVKAVHNMLNYLARQGRLARVSRGRYRLTEIGASVELTEEAPTER